MVNKMTCFLSGDNLEDALFSDLDLDKRTTTIRKLFRGSDSLFIKAREISQSQILKFKHKVFLFIYSLLFCKLTFFSRGIFVFTNPSIQGISPLYFKMLFDNNRRRKAFLILIDKSGKIMAKHAYRCIKYLDKNNVFTFDKVDADEFGFNHSLCIFSRQNCFCESINSDLFFIGYAKDKMSFLKSIDISYGNKLDMQLMVLQPHKPEKEYKDGSIVYLNKYKKYDDVLKLTLSTNCILEVQEQGQAGATMRYYEAICYNKKLLTTNKDIINLPFYNPDYMKIVENINELDVEWIKRREKIEYRYNDDFSPTHIIDLIEEKMRFNEK